MSDTPKFPTCRTCPYWHPGTYWGTDETPMRFPDKDEDPEAEDWCGDGECRRNAPRASAERHGGPLFVDADKHSVAWPRTNEIDWCGEHPAFGAFMAARYQRSRRVMEDES